MKWEELTSPEFNDAVEKSKGLCIMPLGCLERHAEHLVVGCDSLIANYVANLAAEIEPAVVFPTGYWLGEVTGNHALSADDLEKGEKRGYIALKSQTLLSVMTELCEEIHRNGFRKILIVNSHGGNTAFLNFFVRSIVYDKKDYAVMWTWDDQAVNEPEHVYEQALARREEFDLSDAEMETLKNLSINGTGGGHADFMEVALNMGENPNFVRVDKFGSQSGLSTHRADYLAEMGVTHGASWSVNFPNAFDGYAPYGCTQNIGKLYAAVAAERLAKIYKTLKDDEFCVKMSQRDI